MNNIRPKGNPNLIPGGSTYSSIMNNVSATSNIITAPTITTGVSGLSDAYGSVTKMPVLQDIAKQGAQKEYAKYAENYLNTFDTAASMRKNADEIYRLDTEHAKSVKNKKQQSSLMDAASESYKKSIENTQQVLENSRQSTEDLFNALIDEKIGMDPSLSASAARAEAPLSSVDRFNGKQSIAEKRAAALAEKMQNLTSVQKLDVEAIQATARRAAEVTNNPEAFASITDLKPKLSQEIIDMEARAAENAAKRAGENAVKESAEGAAKFLGKHKGKLVGLAAMGAMVFAMSDSKGAQSNAQLYGQAPAYNQ